MAEAWLEEEEEELRELRDSAGNRRNRRANANPATDRSERNKPESRFSGQGALSSIRAVIKRTSRTTAQSEPQRERRRPDITIVAAEPLGPAWFPSVSHGTSGGLAYPPPASQWRNETVPAELPPSYEQVIKEISRVKVDASTDNAAPRLTTTSATQTDFEAEADCDPPESAVNPFVPCSSEPVPKPQTPPRPSVYPLTSTRQEKVPPLTPAQERSQEGPGVGRCPVPRPRSKVNLRPVVTDHKQEEDQEEDQEEPYQLSARRESSPDRLQPPFEENFFEDQELMDSMSTESSQSSIVSRIKAFESQSYIESSDYPRKPESAPRSFVPKPALPAGKPTLAPKPVPSRASEENDLLTENKPKPASRELPPLLPKQQDTGNSAVRKPELPRKPQPSVTKNGVESGSGSALEYGNNDGERSIPVPAPRPGFPKKVISTENPASWTTSLKPVAAVPRLSVATQAKAFASLGEETTANRPTPALQSRTTNQWDLISFDEETLPVSSAAGESRNSEAPAECFAHFSKPDPWKDQPVAPAVLRKPTVIRIPSKASKSLSEDHLSPPPLPSEKPIGSFYNDGDEKPSNTGRTGNWEPESPSWKEGAWALPAMPTRPAGGKVVPARPSVQKGPPGRPPPPKVSSFRAPAQRESFHRSSSDVGLSLKNTHSSMKRSKSQLLRKQEPDLPPRPKPGHPLYNKYMLPVPHGIAQRDCNSRNPEELSCKRGDVLVLLEQVDSNHFQCQKGEESGEVHLSKMKIITPLENRQQDWNSTGDAPHALVLHDYPAEHPDDLSLTSGEFVQLLEKIDIEWYQGQSKGRTGIFPASYVKVLVDVPGPDNGKRKSFPSMSITGPRCMARFEFIGDQDGELSFAEGEVIRLKEYINEEWAKGELRGQVGIFPLNFVEVVEDLPSSWQRAPTVSGFSAQLKSKRDSWCSDSQPQQSSGEWCEALYDFTGETDDDLPFRKGERILITEHIDSEWYRGRLNNKEGILSAAFVKPVADIPKPSPQPQGQKKSKAKALYDFCGENADELTFKAGSLITVLKYIDDDWMSGELQGRSGLFPRNYVQVL